MQWYWWVLRDLVNNSYNNIVCWWIKRIKWVFRRKKPFALVLIATVETLVVPPRTLQTQLNVGLLKRWIKIHFCGLTMHKNENGIKVPKELDDLQRWHHRKCTRVRYWHGQPGEAATNILKHFIKYKHYLQTRLLSKFASSCSCFADMRRSNSEKSSFWLTLFCWRHM